MSYANKQNARFPELFGGSKPNISGAKALYNNDRRARAYGKKMGF